MKIPPDLLAIVHVAVLDSDTGVGLVVAALRLVVALCFVGVLRAFAQVALPVILLLAKIVNAVVNPGLPLNGSRASLGILR